MNYLKLKGDNNFLCLCCLAVVGYLIYLVLYNRPILEGASCGSKPVEGMANSENCEAYNKCIKKEGKNPLSLRRCMVENKLTREDLKKCRNKHYEDIEDDEDDEDDKTSVKKIKKKIGRFIDDSKKGRSKFNFFDKKPNKKTINAKSHLKMIDRHIDQLDSNFDRLMADYPTCLE